MSLGPLMVDLCTDSISVQERKLLESPQVGGIILFSRNFTSIENLTELINEIHAVRHPRLMVAIDQEGGRVQRPTGWLLRSFQQLVYWAMRMIKIHRERVN